MITRKPGEGQLSVSYWHNGEPCITEYVLGLAVTRISVTALGAWIYDIEQGHLEPLPKNWIIV